MKTVLIVEDEKDLAELVAFHLEKEGYRPITAFDGISGLEAASREAPDLVLLDLMLPELGGMEVCRALKGNPKTSVIPVILLTAKNQYDDALLGYQRGTDYYISKPFTGTQLINGINLMTYLLCHIV